MTTQRWICDDEPSLRFPVYTRGNAGEVAPNVMTPLTASLVGDASAEGQRRAMLELGLLRPKDFEGPGANGTGIFGGYLYANLSMVRVACERAPGMTALDADRQMAGLSDDAPPHRHQRGDRNRIATLAMSWQMARHMLRPDISALDAARRDVESRRRQVRPPSECSDDELIAAVLAYPPRWADGMYRLLFFSSFAGASNAILDQLTERAGLGRTSALALTSGLGTVDSAAPALRLWTLGRLVAGSPRLTQLFDERADVLGVVGDAEVERFVEAFQEFELAHGARGPDEWELASSTWGTDPSIAIEAIDRLRRAPADRDPVVARQRLARQRVRTADAVRRGLPRPVRPFFDRVLLAAQRYAEARERAKTIFIDDLHPVRCALFELADRVRARGGPEERRDFFLVTTQELRDFVARPTPFAPVIADRRERRDFLQEREPPFVFDGVLPDPTTWPLRAAPAGAGGVRELHGQGVSAGVARGTVRIVRDPAAPGPLEPGDILVAPITDPAWTPLFLAVAGVVVDVGAQLSHAAIVARELGIPAVVGVANATGRLVDGQQIEIDGAQGTVTVL